MPTGARVTAAWEAVTIPKKSTGQKTVEAASIAFAAGGAWELNSLAGNSLLLARPRTRFSCATGRVVTFWAYGPNPRPRFVDTRKKGTKRIMQMRWGWEKGAALRR